MSTKYRDSYERFFERGEMSKDDFFQFGLEETIYVEKKKAIEAWALLKKEIEENKNIFIRAFGAGGKNTPLFQEFYRNMGHENVKKDPNNNANPTRLIREWTRYSKLKGAKKETSSYNYIRNYQVSHIFGRTKNIYAFTAPWNIVYMPKMLDPFTGHEATGSMIEEYTRLFQRKGYEEFSDLIEDFNEIISAPTFLKKIKYSLEKIEQKHDLGKDQSKSFESLKFGVEEAFKPIIID